MALIFNSRMWAVNRPHYQTQKNTYTSWLDIPAWIIRNLMENKNCLVNKIFYSEVYKQFEYVFGKDNLSFTESGTKQIVLKVTESGVERARPYITE